MEYYLLHPTNNALMSHSWSMSLTWLWPTATPDHPACSLCSKTHNSQSHTHCLTTTCPLVRVPLHLVDISECTLSSLTPTSHQMWQWMVVWWQHYMSQPSHAHDVCLITTLPSRVVSYQSTWMDGSRSLSQWSWTTERTQCRWHSSVTQHDSQSCQIRP